MTRTPSRGGDPSDFPDGSSADSPFRLLGEQLQGASERPEESASGLRALVIYAAEYAKLHGSSLGDFLGALESTLALYGASLPPSLHDRLRVAIRHWGRLAFENTTDEQRRYEPPTGTSPGDQ